MHNPPHPGRLLKIQLIEDEDGNTINSVAEAAKKLGCHRNTLNRVLNGSASISPQMALQIEEASGSSAEFWLKLQMDFDLFQLRHPRVA